MCWLLVSGWVWGRTGDSVAFIGHRWVHTVLQQWCMQGPGPPIPQSSQLCNREHTASCGQPFSCGGKGTSGPVHALYALVWEGECGNEKLPLLLPSLIWLINCKNTLSPLPPPEATPLQCDFAFAPISKWSLFPHPLHLSLTWNSLWPTEYGISDDVPVLSLSLNRFWALLPSLSQTPWLPCKQAHTTGWQRHMAQSSCHHHYLSNSCLTYELSLPRPSSPQPSCLLTTDAGTSQAKTSQTWPKSVELTHRLVSNNKCLLFSVTEFWSDLLHSNTWLIHLHMTGWCNTSLWAFRYFISQIDWNPAIYITRIVPGSVNIISLLS